MNHREKRRRTTELLLDPPAEFGVMPFWFLNDELDEREIVRQIADFAGHGVGGFVLHPRIGLPRSLAWMSDRLLDFYEVAIREAGKRGLRVVLYDEGMYPSGSSAGQVVAENPAYACRCFSQRILDGDAPPQLAPGENLVAVVARHGGGRIAVVDQPSGSFVRGLHYKRDIDSEWKAGAVPDSEGEFPPAADLLNPEAVACFLRLVHDRFAARFSRYFGNTIMAIFTDEPHTLSKCGTWNVMPGTTGFLKEANRLLGYDFTPGLRARHVRKEGWHVFMLFNETSTPLDTAIELPVAGDGLSFDPATGVFVSRPAGQPLRMAGHELTVLLMEGITQA